MSVCAAAFVPCAPLLVPAIAGGSAALDDGLRSASFDAVRRLIAAEPSEILVVAPISPSSRPPTYPADATWDFNGFGVPRVGSSAARPLPWQLGIGSWLLDECRWQGQRRHVGVCADDVTDSAADDVIGAAERVAILALGDGSACRTERAPGYLDDRAADFDAAIATALARGDGAALAATDAHLAAELCCAGLPVWRWLVRRVEGQPVLTASLDAHEAPYGVGYFVASWELA